jgi:hypothetical protein
MVAPAVVYAGAFLFSIGVTGLLVWRRLDELLGEVRPLRPYALSDGAPCPRCLRRLPATTSRCPRCHLAQEHLPVRAAQVKQRYAVATGLDFGNYLELLIDTSDARRIAIVAPAGLAVRPGDELDLVFEGRRLRELNNRTLATGWRLPSRLRGQRSAVSMIGFMILVPVVTLLLLVAPLYFLAHAVEQSAGEVSRLLASGAQRSPTPHLASSETAPILVYLGALLGFGGLLALVRSRPRVNRDVLRP